MDRVSVSEAAARLGVTPDAVRQRIRRGTIQYEKTDEGRYYVFLSEHDGRRDGVRDALVDRLMDEIEFLRSELQRKDAILLSMAEGLKALDPPSEPRESPLTASEERDGNEVPPGPEKPVSSWWRRIFGSS